jgi:hypothetical protein
MQHAVEDGERLVDLVLAGLPEPGGGGALVVERRSAAATETGSVPAGCGRRPPSSRRCGAPSVVVTSTCSAAPAWPRST